MLRGIYAITALTLAMTIGSGASWAQNGEGDAAWRLVAQEEPAAPGDEPAKSPDEPGKSPDEPGKSPDEPAKSAGEPAKGEPPAPTVAAKPKAHANLGAGMHIRGLFVPTWFLNLFLDASTPLNSMALGGEFVRRKGNFDIVASVNFGFYSPQDGNYLGNGKNPAVDTDYIQFRGLNLLAFDVAFIGHHYFLPWLSLVYGAGLGFGVVLGDIYRISDHTGNCNSDNIGDFGKCNPVDPTDTASLARWNEDRDKWLADAPKCSSKDSPDAPCQYREEDVWPVIPIVHLLVGVNFKINEQFSVRVDGGFHDAFYVGAAGHYFFW